MNHLILALMILSQISETRGLSSWCSPYDTFCLFSEGNEVRVSSLSEAQLKCSEIKNDSWPVELGDERVKEVFIEFINNHSISNVILNAFNRNGNWYWKSNISIPSPIDRNFQEDKDILFYSKNSKHRDLFSSVCRTNCYATWTETSHVGMDDLNVTHFLQANTLEKCKEVCERNATCSFIDWTSNGCLTHNKLYQSSKPRSKKRETSLHHVIDRSSKSVDKCVAEGLNGNGSKLSLISTSSIPTITAAVFLYLHQAALFGSYK